MTTRRFIYSTPFILVTALLFILNSFAKAKPPINKDAKALAKAIPTYKPGGNKESAAKQMNQMIQILASTKRNSVSSNSALLSKAFDFRDDIGAQQESVTIGAVLKAWETAYDHGAIRQNKFTGTSSNGRYQGQKLVYENIVPAELLPEAAGYIGNLRLVPAPLARKKGAPLNRRDQAYAIGLKQVMHESKSRAAMLDIEKSKVGHLGQSKSEHEERWQREVNETGQAYKEPPVVRLSAQKKGTPSKLNGNTYGLELEISNLSRHPTEVEIESTIVGYTDKNNRLYIMKKDVRKLKLRRSQVDEFKIKTPNVSAFSKALQGIDPLPLVKGKVQPQRVIYRGYTVVAKFNGKVITTTGSDGRLAKVASGEYSAPAKVLK